MGLPGRWEDVCSPGQEGGRDIRGGHCDRGLGKWEDTAGLLPGGLTLFHL